MRFVRQYFGYLASQSFKTAPDGTRLFYPGELWGRPYVVPDAETEQRLLRKQRWVLGLSFTPLFIMAPFLGRTPSALTFLGLFAIMLVVFLVAQYFLFRTERGTLTRATTRLSRRELVADSAARHSTTTWVLYLVFALILLASSLFLMPRGADPVVKWLTVGILGLMTAGLAYVLIVKLSGRAPTGAQAEVDRP